MHQGNPCQHSCLHCGMREQKALSAPQGDVVLLPLCQGLLVTHQLASETKHHTLMNLLMVWRDSGWSEGCSQKL